MTCGERVVIAIIATFLVTSMAMCSISMTYQLGATDCLKQAFARCVGHIK